MRASTKMVNATMQVDSSQHQGMYTKENGKMEIAMVMESLCQTQKMSKSKVIGLTMNGKGYEISELHGHIYYGNYQDGKKHGEGSITFSDDTKYRGEFYEDQITGKGIKKYPNG